MSQLSAALWPGNDVVTVLICLGLGGFAVLFFTIVFVADRGEARRRAASKRANRRARKHFARAAHKSEPRGGEGIRKHGRLDAQP